MNYFLAKTEAEEFSIDDLMNNGPSPWTGVNNPQAKSFLRSMKNGDFVFIYHTGNVRAIVGLAKVTSVGEIPTFTFVKKYKTPIATLSEIKSHPEFSDLKLVRQSRLSVMDVPPKLLSFLNKKEASLN